MTLALSLTTTMLDGRECIKLADVVEDVMVAAKGAEDL